MVFDLHAKQLHCYIAQADVSNADDLHIMASLQSHEFFLLN